MIPLIQVVKVINEGVYILVGVDLIFVIHPQIMFGISTVCI